MSQVLVVDDQAANRLLLESLLRRFGYQVILAADAQEALSQFNKQTPDIVLLDVMMPGISGYQLAPQLKKQAGVAHLPIIFITALDDQTTLLRCLSVGGDDFLPVPFEPVVLQAKLRAHERVRQLSLSLHEKNRSLAWHSARIEREHTIVEHIFQNALSRNFLDFENIETYVSPASMFSGDICLVAPGPLGNLYVFLGDFTGHGLAPATGALPLSQAFFTMAERGVAVAEMVTEFNERLASLLPDDMFCAAILAELSANGERLTYWNGGMPSAVLLNDEGVICQELKSQHLALGILSVDDFDSRVSHLNEVGGSRLFLYTDGVTEALGQDQQLFGEQTLQELICEHRPLTLAPIIAALEAHRGQQRQQDDISMALLNCLPTCIPEEPAPPHPQRLPFKLQVSLGLNEIKFAEPVSSLMNALGQLPTLKAYRTTIYMLLSEAYNNALEHGLLGLDSRLKELEDGFADYYQERERRLATLERGSIDIAIEFDPYHRQLQFSITDSGLGHSIVGTNATASEEVEQPHGRGLSLLQELTQELYWSEDGRTVEFIFRLD